MSSIKEKLTNMFSKVMAGTVTREEGTMLINHLVKEDPAGTVNELAYLVENPPPGVFQKTILHTIALARNKAFFGIMVSCLEHKNEEVSALAAQELAKLRTAEARQTLTEHLDSESYQVRKASALAISEGLADGTEVLKNHILRSSEPFYRLTSAQALGRSGKKGVEALLSVMMSGNQGAMSTAAEVLVAEAEEVDQSEVSSVFDALMVAGDRKDSQSIIELLKVVGALKGKAGGFEGFVLAFADYPSEIVRNEAQNALKMIRS
jgi:HEAT repeat protein